MSASTAGDRLFSTSMLCSAKRVYCYASVVGSRACCDWCISGSSMFAMDNKFVMLCNTCKIYSKRKRKLLELLEEIVFVLRSEGLKIGRIYEFLREHVPLYRFHIL